MVRPVNAGDMRHRVELRRKTDSGTRDEANRIAYTWASIWDTRALVESLSGSELEQARTVMANASWRVIVRQPPQSFTPTTADRWYVTREAKTLEIGYISHDPQRRAIEFICGESVS